MGSTSLISIMLFILIFIVFPIISLFQKNDTVSAESLDVHNNDNSLEVKESKLNKNKKIHYEFIFGCLFGFYVKTILGIGFILVFVNPYLVVYYLILGFIVGLLPLFAYYLIYIVLLKLKWANFFTSVIFAVFICYIFLFVMLGGSIGKMLFPIGVIHSVLIAIFSHKKYLNKIYG